MEMEEMVNVKILKLTIENKEMNRSWLRWQLIEGMVGPKEERKGLEEIEQQYQKILKEFKYKKEVLERKKELWLQNEETKTNIIDNVSIHILQMKSMITREEFRQLKAKKEEER